MPRLQGSSDRQLQLARESKKAYTQHSLSAVVELTAELNIDDGDWTYAEMLEDRGWSIAVFDADMLFLGKL